MKKKITYITQTDPTDPTQKEVIRVTEKVLDNSSDVIVKKHKLDLKEMRKKRRQLDKDIERLQSKRDEVDSEIKTVKKLEKAENTFSIKS
jgi:predicted translin family RNA/ssDNA-binding protein